MTIRALAASQSLISGVIANEQTRTSAVSIAFDLRSGSNKSDERTFRVDQTPVHPAAQPAVYDKQGSALDVASGFIDRSSGIVAGPNLTSRIAFEIPIAGAVGCVPNQDLGPVRPP
jgi:hypothetical protein